MAKCISILRNNSFINQSRLPFLCEKAGAVALAQPGLTADRQADEKLLHLEIFRRIYWTKH